ncbi:bis(5'-nucleosyl)-tetraphosphatase (symmetrical) YqeK [Halobacillus salinarum]|uniref:bis(5'-nucleosyl)-tetraphosphatase (symmetrical) n=1 Tax=Halobacillus salinarum TaxID=2932257 RepID=A0ABY4ERN9_9BACI|nr:bis(5'-nucleosyl)-tetraphosphatase (symmetrical) YqeK [Halobacillus salinarum]UOQ46319.1 bis(5'-nucleosyl)-tetraphosphatase (symmetrical) YqeK [Halobacillus salinarum]
MKLNREDALHFVAPHLKQSRYEHTVRVTDTAMELAKKYGADLEKTELASILHDFAKHKPKDLMKRWIMKDRRLPKDMLSYHHGLWHGPVASVMLEQEIGLSDEDIKSAISCHTTGKKHMSVLDQVVFLADYIEPGREFPGVEEVRELAESSLEQACFAALKNTVQHLILKERTVYPDTIHAYNDFLHRTKEQVK